MSGPVSEMQERVCTVEHEPGWGWIARCPWSGFEIPEPGFRWNSRSAARSVVDERRAMGRDAAWEERQRAMLDAEISIAEGGKSNDL